MTKHTISNIPKMSTKELMEWFTSEYDVYYLSSDLSNIILVLEGLCAGMGRDHPAFYICNDALSKLRNFRHLLSMLELTKYTYAGDNNTK